MPNWEYRAPAQRHGAGALGGPGAGAAPALSTRNADHMWVERKFREQCEGYGTKLERDSGEEGQIVIEVKVEA